VSSFNLSRKLLITLGFALCFGLAAYLTLSKKSDTVSSSKDIAPSAPQILKQVTETKSATVYQEKQDQQSQLKALEFKVSEARAKREKLLRLRTVIEEHIKLRQDLLKPAQDKISHFEKLQTEGALNDQDIELARSQLVSIQGLIEKASKDKDKVTKLISDQETELTKAETELKKFKSL
jgi:hypothetical protein